MRSAPPNPRTPAPSGHANINKVVVGSIQQVLFADGPRLHAAMCGGAHSVEVSMDEGANKSSGADCVSVRGSGNVTELEYHPGGDGKHPSGSVC